jgi:hypothetical protein
MTTIFKLKCVGCSHIIHTLGAECTEQPFCNICYSPMILLAVMQVDMSGNSELTLEQADAVEESKKRTIQEQFNEFHQRHPNVYTSLCQLARQYKSQGHDHYSLDGMWDILRWRTKVGDTLGFKLNNIFRSRYARMIMEREPDLAGFFNTRNLRRA